MDKSTYKLELDLRLYFVPPMHEHGPAICLTREVELPFPPQEDLVIYSQAWDVEASGLTGYVLKEVVWDIDRRVFLAHTTVVDSDVPIPFIPSQIATWLDHGWRLGSCQDIYERDLGDDDEPERVETGAVDEWEQAEEWPKMPPRKRTKAYSEAFGAIIRSMAEIHNHESVAYAMDKTKQFFEEKDGDKDPTPAMRRFADAKGEYLQMSFEEQDRWRTRVLRKYTPMRKLLARLPSSRDRE